MQTDWLARTVALLTSTWTRPHCAVHRTIAVIDVARFSQRINPHQLYVRGALYRILRRAFSMAGISWDLCDREDRGDGVFLLASPHIPKSRFAHLLPIALVEALREHNRQHAPPRQIRLRMALHAGEVHYDDHGAAGAAINLAFRLVEAPQLKAALDKSSGVLGLIASNWFFSEVVKHSTGSRPETYRPVTVSVKETQTEAWIRLPGSRTATRNTVPRQLPAVPPFFAGRRSALAGLKTMTTATITGMGGVGKTWLALRWAHDNLDRFPDGQLYVNLRGFEPSGEPTQVTTAVRGFLDALGVAPAAVPADLDAMTALYRSLVADKRMLILLDNALDTAQVAPLLPGSATCTVLVTSRHRLTRLVIGHGAQPLELDVLDDEEAYELLAGRIGSARLAAEPAAAAQLLDRCAGLPLALGIVAAHAATHAEFGLSSLAAELESERLDGFSSGELSADLRATMSWSYHALGPEQARMFRLLGMMTGPAVSVLGAAALTALPEATCRDILRDLADTHLVQQHAPGRYRMHDLVRLYAAERASTDVGTVDAVQRLVLFYLHSAYAAERILYPHRNPIVVGEPQSSLPQFDDDTAALAWFDAELPNLLAAQAFAAKHHWNTVVWQLGWVLHGYLWRRGLICEQLVAWRAGLAAAQRQGDPAAKALAYRLFGQTATRAGLADEAKAHLEQALVLARAAGDLHGEARTHYDLAEMWAHQVDMALSHAAMALQLFKSLGNGVWEAEALNLVGRTQARNGNLTVARSACERALELFAQHGNRQGQATTMTSLGYIAHQAGAYRSALSFYCDSLALYRELGARYEEAETLEQLGRVHAALGCKADAERAWRRALGLYVEQCRRGAADEIRLELSRALSA